MKTSLRGRKGECFCFPPPPTYYYLIDPISFYSIPSFLFLLFSVPFISSYQPLLVTSPIEKKKKTYVAFWELQKKPKNSLIGSKPCLLPLLLEGDTYASRLRGFFLYLHLYLSVDNKNKTIEQNKTGWGGRVAIACFRRVEEEEETESTQLPLLSPSCVTTSPLLLARHTLCIHAYIPIPISNLSMPSQQPRICYPLYPEISLLDPLISWYSYYNKMGQAEVIITYSDSTPRCWIWIWI